MDQHHESFVNVFGHSANMRFGQYLFQPRKPAPPLTSRRPFAVFRESLVRVGLAGCHMPAAGRQRRARQRCLLALAFPVALNDSAD
jgi:hypothetical protein